MTGATSGEGFPYPYPSDFADVQDAFRLATDVDREVQEEQAAFRSFIGRPSFIARQTVAGSLFQGGTSFMTFGAIDWDNTGGLAIGASVWRQPLSAPPAWWLFGATLLETPSGGVVVGEAIQAMITVTTIDQVTRNSSSTRFYQRNDESGTNGEWINIFAMAPIYRGTVSLALQLGGTTSKGILAGSRFWGMYLGPVV